MMTRSVRTVSPCSKTMYNVYYYSALRAKSDICLYIMRALAQFIIFLPQQLNKTIATNPARQGVLHQTSGPARSDVPGWAIFVRIHPGRLGQMQSHLPCSPRRRGCGRCLAVCFSDAGSGLCLWRGKRCGKSSLSCQASKSIRLPPESSKPSCFPTSRGRWKSWAPCGKTSPKLGRSWWERERDE